MLLRGEWLISSDGVERPFITGTIAGAGDVQHESRFLIDSGADRTVFPARLAELLGLTVEAPSPRSHLVGVGGVTGHVLVQTVIEFDRHDGQPARIRGRFAIFLDPDATDVCILGRDVLNNFDVIISYRRREVLLLAPHHGYAVTEPSPG